MIPKYKFQLFKDASNKWKYKTRFISAAILTLTLILDSVSVAAFSAPFKPQKNSGLLAVSTVTFISDADARVEEHSPTTNFGTAPDLEVIQANNRNKESYIRFTVSGLSGVVQSALLRVYSTTEGTKNGPAAYATGTSWAETGITWNNRPARTGGALDNKGAIGQNTWTEYNVTALVNGNGTYAFVLAGDSSDDVFFSSRQGGNPPQLAITVSTSTPTVTPASAKTSTPTATSSGPMPTPTNTPSSSDLIFADGFESGNLSAWTASVVDAGDLSVTSAAALVGAKGLQAVIDDNNLIYVTDDHPNAEPRYRVRFYFDPNSISMASGDSHRILSAFAGTSTAVLRTTFRYSSGAYQIQFNVLNDSGTWLNTSWATLSDAKHAIEFDWQAATSAGANNGSLAWWVDGGQQAGLSGVDNDTLRIDRVRLGGVYGIQTGTRGTYFFDDFVSRRQSYIGP